MKALMLGSVLAAGLAVGLLSPATAEAGHRHSRNCGHGYGYSRSYRHYSPAPYYGRGYYPSYGAYYGHRHHSRCGHRVYGYGYGYYAPPAYVVAPPRPPYYCPRPRISVHLGF